MSTMKLMFNDKISQHTGGERYAPGKVYYLDKHEACLWIKRGAVDLGSVEPAHITPEAIAEHEGNLLPGRALGLSEVLAAMSE